ncbi:hypothetical protein V2G26_020404 [Clonostachys chloroleuca]
MKVQKLIIGFLLLHTHPYSSQSSINRFASVTALEPFENDSQLIPGPVYHAAIEFVMSPCDAYRPAFDANTIRAVDAIWPGFFSLVAPIVLYNLSPLTDLMTIVFGLFGRARL